jgi:Flp pilus assembly protein TadG
MTDCYITLGFRWLDGDNDMKTWQTFSRLLKDRSGNFGMMTAIMLPVLLGAGGVALDVTNMMISKNQLQDAADAASLAASTALANGEAANEQEARELAREFFIGQVSNYMGSETAEAIGNATDIDVTTTTNQNGKGFEVRVGTNYDLALTPLMGVLGYQTVDVGVRSVSKSGTTDTKSALSMMLVLDESGSMSYKTNATKEVCVKYNKKGKCKETDTVWVTKIEALKLAANALFDALDTADPTHVLTRTGAISYDHFVVGQTSPLMSWGTETARSYVQDIDEPPEGGTDASDAVEDADAAIARKLDGSDTETREHANKQNTRVDRYMILMTDGEMTGYSNQWKPAIHNEVYRNCQAAKDKDIVIFTVAFMAPKNGQDLLQACASSPTHYFQAETMEALVSSFSSIAQHATKARTLLTN